MQGNLARNSTYFPRPSFLLKFEVTFLYLASPSQTYFIPLRVIGDVLNLPCRKFIFHRSPPTSRACIPYHYIHNYTPIFSYPPRRWQFNSGVSFPLHSMIWSCYRFMIQEDALTVDDHVSLLIWLNPKLMFKNYLNDNIA